MVCMGNVCRSPMAQYVTLHLASHAGMGSTLRVDSAGTHAVGGNTPIDPRARIALAGRGYPIGKGRSRQVADADFERSDLVLAMDSANMGALRQLCPGEHTHKLRLLLEFAPAIGMMDIPDPYYGSADGFEKVLDLCEAGARGLLERLISLPR